MPIYEFLCRVCGARFEARRPMAESSLPIACPGGHPDSTRLLSVFASVSASSGATSPTTDPARPCGPACRCAG